MLFAAQAIEPGSGHKAGLALLSRLYRQQTGRELPPMAVTSRGKPYFPGERLHFSISHTRRHAFCVLSDRPVGLDAEELDRGIDLRLADRILSHGERVQYDRAADKRLALLTFWVLKEAAVKCTGEGLRGYPKNTNFALDDPRVFTRDGCILAIIEEEDHAV